MSRCMMTECNNTTTAGISDVSYIRNDGKGSESRSRSPPGSCSRFKDESFEFWRDVVSFFDRRSTEHQSRVFNGRLLMKSTTFIGSNAGVRELLTDQAEFFDMGYKEYFSHIYGDIVLFAEDSTAEDMRATLASMLHHDSVCTMKEKISRLISMHFSKLDISNSVCIYSVFKQLASEIMICLFLDLNLPEDSHLLSEIISLSVTHWHGIISFPISWKMPLGFSSGCRKALDARAKLLEIVNELWQKKMKRKSKDCENSFLYEFKQMPFSSEAVAKDHLILLITALIPKAVASLLTSCLMVGGSWKGCLNDEGKIEEEELDCILLEVGRLWPPFIGGRRIARKDVRLDGFFIPCGRPVVFLTHAAHRDPLVFENVDHFDWKRWQKENKLDRDKVFFFGSGTRSCVGKMLVDVILKEILKQFFEQYQWQFEELASAGYKWLPVSRPKKKPLVKLFPMFANK